MSVPTATSVRRPLCHRHTHHTTSGLIYLWPGGHHPDWWDRPVGQYPNTFHLHVHGTRWSREKIVSCFLTAPNYHLSLSWSPSDFVIEFLFYCSLACSVFSTCLCFTWPDKPRVFLWLCFLFFFFSVLTPFLDGFWRGLSEGVNSEVRNYSENLSPKCVCVTLTHCILWAPSATLSLSTQVTAYQTGRSVWHG